jgi:hypothetical protein
VVGDTAKLVAHRLIARRLRRDPSLVERAEAAHARQANEFAAGSSCEWEDLLALPLGELASKLISRDREMVRLRNSSPFYLAEGVDLGDYDARLRLRRAARRVAKRASGASPKDRPDEGTESIKWKTPPSPAGFFVSYESRGRLIRAFYARRRSAERAARRAALSSLFTSSGCRS